jgi:hypothetical protein
MIIIVLILLVILLIYFEYYKTAFVVFAVFAAAGYVVYKLFSMTPVGKFLGMGESVEMSPKTREIEKLIGAFLEKHGVDDSHNMKHINIVVKDVIGAIGANDAITDEQAQEIIMGALLHEADDHKYFPKNEASLTLRDTYKNAFEIMREVDLDDATIDNVLKIISIVGCSENKNRKDADIPDWMYYVRYADRLQGVEVKRAINYSKHKEQPAFTEDTLRAVGDTDEEMKRDLYARIATPERYEEYSGASKSAIDHIADKLLHILDFGTDNTYLNAEKRQQQEELERIYLDFSKNGEITFERMLELV